MAGAVNASLGDEYHRLVYTRDKDLELPSTPLPAIPASPGTYLLILCLPGAINLQVGKLGEAEYKPGYYLYAGSAAGPGGLSARIGRHIKKDKPIHWHIDYLRAAANVVGWVYTRHFSHDGRLECVWSQALLSMPLAQVPQYGFGSSDCCSGCPAHLVYLPDFTPACGKMEAIPVFLEAVIGTLST